MTECPTMIGKYKIIGEIARGGMGIVYKAYHPDLRSYVILKKLSLKANTAVRERFKREAQLLMPLTDTHIVRVFDLFVENQSYYIVLEFVDGLSLDKILKKQVSLSPQMAMLVLRDACHGLTIAHKHGIVHRDIKPGNILISKHAEIKIADFGIASTDTEREQAAGQEHGNVTLGTPSYMPPEQFDDSRSVDNRADIYAMGIMLYEMVTGTKPYPGSFTPETIAKIKKGKYISPRKINKNIPHTICHLIRKMTQVKPKNRFQKIEKVTSILERYLEKYNAEAIRDSLANCVKYNVSKAALRKIFEEPQYKERNRVFKLIATWVCIGLLFCGAMFYLWTNGLIHKTILSPWYTPVSLSLELPTTAKIDADLPMRAFFFENDNDLIPELEDARRAFIYREVKNNEGKIVETEYKTKNVYLRPGEYRLKVVTGAYIWWQSISVGKEPINLNLTFLQKEMRPIKVTCSAIDATTGVMIPSEDITCKFSINNKWVPETDIKEGELTSGSIVKVLVESPGYISEYFSLRIEWYQDDLYINARLQKK